MRPDPAASPAHAGVRVTVRDWAGVQRVVLLLTSRAYVVGSFAATPSASGASWQVSLALHCDEAALPLLRARLERIPAVTAVRTSPGADAHVG